MKPIKCHYLNKTPVSMRLAHRTWLLDHGHYARWSLSRHVVLEAYAQLTNERRLHFRQAMSQPITLLTGETL